MKKLTSIVFSIYYVLAFVGIEVNLHYCQGKLQSVEVLTNKGSCCCNGMESNQGCCYDKTVLFQYDNDEKLNSIYRFEWEQTETFISENFSLIEDIQNISPEAAFNHNNLPPPSGPPLWLLNCSLTYYG